MLFDPNGCVRVRIRRLHDFEKRWVMHGYLEPNEATEGRVAELFGGGKYQASRLVNDGTGRHVVSRTVEFTLPGAYKPPQGLPGIDRPAPGDSGAAGAGAGLGVVGERVNMNEALNHVLVSKVLDAVKASNELSAGRKAVDYTPLLAAGLGLLEKVLGARGPDPAMALLMSRLDEMQARLERAAAQPGPVASAAGDSLKVLRDLLELTDTLRGGGGGGGDPDAKMWELGARALEVLGARREGAESSPSPERPTTMVPAKLPVWQRTLLQYRGTIVGAARRGMDPGLAADVALQMMDPALTGVVEEFFRLDNAESMILQTIPELAETPTWVRGFVGAVREALAGDGGDETPEG